MKTKELGYSNGNYYGIVEMYGDMNTLYIFNVFNETYEYVTDVKNLKNFMKKNNIIFINK